MIAMALVRERETRRVQKRHEILLLLQRKRWKVENGLLMTVKISNNGEIKKDKKEITPIGITKGRYPQERMRELSLAFPKKA